MKFNQYILAPALMLSVFPTLVQAAGPPPETLLVSGLSQPVEIIKDRWGIAHIYAKSEADLFCAQG